MMAKSDGQNGKSERDKRLAAELRANLRRRKDKGRAIDSQTSADAEPPASGTDKES